MGRVHEVGEYRNGRRKYNFISTNYSMFVTLINFSNIRAHDVKRHNDIKLPRNSHNSLFFYWTYIYCWIRSKSKHEERKDIHYVDHENESVELKKKLM